MGLVFSAAQETGCDVLLSKVVNGRLASKSQRLTEAVAMNKMYETEAAAAMMQVAGASSPSPSAQILSDAFIKKLFARADRNFILKNIDFELK